ncbi:class I SAM-dependent methyltransferase [Schaalia sp. ZJ1691]|uniref:class I SAM-dependent methyltransferase n=1 Tax=Schaalia sp. ZJ1691 TaxID=2709404 RepID=UPI0013EAE90C|nr:class I SAM-dependent methyltransferase [Schaalia sp. ZJ1691]
MPSILDPITSSPGWQLLQSLDQRLSTQEDLSQSQPVDTVALVHALRKSGVDASLASALASQIELRRHARTKFGDFASSMVFTRDGLEQATRMTVAAHHAGRFRDGGASFVADLGCGIGSDSLAIAGLGLRVLAVDIDPDAAAAAAVNLRAFDSAEVQQGDIGDLSFDDLRRRGVDAVFTDPARRSGSHKGGARITAPQKWSPPLSTVLGWADVISRVGVKVAPGLPYDAIPCDWHAQWVSVDGDLVEASLWSPALSPEGPGRSALVISGGHAHVLRDTSSSSPNDAASAVEVGDLADMIAEPDPAVIRAGGLATLANDLGLHIVSEKIAYLSANDIAPSPFLTRFQVLDVVPLKAKAIANWCHAHDIKSLEIKKRGVNIDPAALRKSLKLQGSQSISVILTRIMGRHRAIFVQRCTIK